MLAIAAAFAFLLGLTRLALAVMAIVGVAAVRERVLPVGVGAVTLLLTAASLAATLVIGLPYSSSLVYPVFALMVGVTGLLSRRPD